MAKIKDMELTEKTHVASQEEPETEFESLGQVSKWLTFLLKIVR